MSHHEVLASNTPSDDWERDGEGVWKRKTGAIRASLDTWRTSQTTQPSIFDTAATHNRDFFHNATNASSVTAEHDVELDRHEDDFSHIHDDSEDSENGKAFRQAHPSDTTQMMAGIGSVHASEGQRRWMPGRLEETYDQYAAQYVVHKAAQSCQRLQDAMAGKPAESQPYQVAALSHDELCYSNGPDRINEERSAFCASVNGLSPVGHRCNVCHVPPDYYDASAYRASASAGGQLRQEASRKRSKPIVVAIALALAIVLVAVAIGRLVH